jgi:hypothetical protein
MTVHSKLQPDESAAAVAATETAFASARKLRADLDIPASEASAALAAATEFQAALAGRIARGQGVSAKEAASAASAIIAAREHAVLFVGAKAQAQTTVDAAEREYLDAFYSHEIHSIREKRRDLAGKQRDMAQKAIDYAESVEATRNAGEALITLQRDAMARGKRSVGHYGGDFDQSLTGVRFLVRSLPGWLIQCLRENPIDHADYFAIADMQDKEATL